MSGELARGPLYYDKNGSFFFLLTPSVVKKKKRKKKGLQIGYLNTHKSTR